MAQEILGAGDGTGLTISVVTANFNAFVTSGLLEGALGALREAGVRDEAVRVIRVPGAFEIPLAAQVASEGNVDAVVCLGAVIRGDTPHFDFVSKAVTDGVLRVMIDRGVPVAFGVITTDTVEQAIERASAGPANKGAEAVRTAIEMVHVLRRLQNRPGA